MSRYVPASAARIEKNNSVREVLSREGDDGTAIRHVRHYIYPLVLPSQRKDRIVARLASFGFAICDAAAHEGLILDHEREVASADFDNLTEALERITGAENWEYDGWECAIVNTLPQ